MDGLVAEGVPDFKLFTAYPGVFYSDDGAIFRAMQQTAKNGGLIMMHAENGMAIDVVAAQTVDSRHDRSHRPRPGAQGGLRGRGHEPRDPPGRGGRGARVHRPPVREGRADRGACGPRPRLDGVRRDVPAVPVPVARRPRQRVRRGEIRMLPAPPTEGPLGGALEGPRQGRPAGRVDRPLPVRLRGPEGTRPGRLPEGPERAARRRGPGRPAARRRRGRRPDHPRTLGRGDLDRARQAVRDVSDARARSASGPTPTW